jgi:hypothetical protein
MQFLKHALVAIAATMLVMSPFLLATPPQAQAAKTKEKVEITKDAQASIDKGTKWLLKAIRRDGGVGVDIGAPPDIGCTAIVGLALMSQGSSPIGGPHSQELDRILGFILRAVAQMPNSNITSETGTLLQRKVGDQVHTFLAALFLSQVMGECHDEDEVKAALERLTHVIATHQQKDGTWGSQSWAPMLGTVMGWISLRSSFSAGFKVEASADKTAEALLKQIKEQRGQNQGWMHDLYKNVCGIRVLYSMGREKDEIYQSAIKEVMQLVKANDQAFQQAGGEDYIAFHFITECMMHQRNGLWEEWYPLMRDKLVRHQNADGSWTGHHCITARTFCTACSLLVLQAPKRYLAISDL